MERNYRATAIFSRIISLTSSDGVLWEDSAVVRQGVGCLLFVSLIKSYIIQYNYVKRLAKIAAKAV